MNKIKKIIKKIIKFYYTNKTKKIVSEHGILHINRRSIVTPNTKLGNNVHFNGMTIQGKGRIRIGNNFHSGSECQILSDVHNYEGESLPYDSTFILKSINIEDNVWFGNRVLVIGNVNIGEGAIIQAGSVVVSDIPPYSIAGGNPAKVFSQRNQEHYNKVKSKESFI